MKKSTLMTGLLVFVAVAWCFTAYAGGDPNTCPVHGFFESVGGFLYNALPWNWGNWMGK